MPEDDRRKPSQPPRRAAAGQRATGRAAGGGDARGRRRRGAAGGIAKASNAKASNAKAPPRRSGPAAAEGRGSTPRGGPGRADRIADEIRRTARPGRSEAALAAFERAVGLLERDRDVAAIGPAEEAKSLAPRSGAIREILGIALYRAGRFKDALRELQAYRR